MYRGSFGVERSAGLSGLLDRTQRFAGSAKEAQELPPKPETLRRIELSHQRPRTRSASSPPFLACQLRSILGGRLLGEEQVFDLLPRHGRFDRTSRRIQERTGGAHDGLAVILARGAILDRYRQVQAVEHDVEGFPRRVVEELALEIPFGLLREISHQHVRVLDRPVGQDPGWAVLGQGVFDEHAEQRTPDPLQLDHHLVGTSPGQLAGVCLDEVPVRLGGLARFLPVLGAELSGSDRRILDEELPHLVFQRGEIQVQNEIVVLLGALTVRRIAAGPVEAVQGVGLYLAVGSDRPRIWRRQSVIPHGLHSLPGKVRLQRRSGLDQLHRKLHLLVQRPFLLEEVFADQEVILHLVESGFADHGLDGAHVRTKRPQVNVLFVLQIPRNPALLRFFEALAQRLGVRPRRFYRHRLQRVTGLAVQFGKDGTEPALGIGPILKRVLHPFAGDVRKSSPWQLERGRQHPVEVLQEVIAGERVGWQRLAGLLPGEKRKLRADTVTALGIGANILAPVFGVVHAVVDAFAVGEDLGQLDAVLVEDV